MSEENPNDNHASEMHELDQLQGQYDAEDEARAREESIQETYEPRESEFEQDYVTGEHERATIQAEEGQ